MFHNTIPYPHISYHSRSANSLPHTHYSSSLFCHSLPLTASAAHSYIIHYEYYCPPFTYSHPRNLATLTLHSSPDVYIRFMSLAQASHTYYSSSLPHLSLPLTTSAAHSCIIHHEYYQSPFTYSHPCNLAMLSFHS